MKKMWKIFYGKICASMVVVLPDPFQEQGAWRNSTETQQSGHAPRSEPESKMEEVVPKMACRRSSDARQSRRRWLLH